MLADVLLASGIAAFVWMTILWRVSLWRRDASIVDPAWGPSFLVVTLTAIGVAGVWTEARAILLLLLVAIWGLRLGIHLLARNLRSGEDPRYAAWREEHGANWWWRSYFQVFLLQGAILWIVALVLVEPIERGGAVGALAFAGAAVALAGIAFEATADAQLARFKRDPANRGRVMESGLWRYSRHPNYFGESVIWWGIWLVALGVGGAWWTIVSPIVMTFLLLKVSGVAMLERRMKDEKPGYEDYKRRTSAFIPLPPRGS